MFWRRKRNSEDFANEIQAHLQLEADELQVEGLTRDAAQSAAQRAFGNVTAVREKSYERGRMAWADELAQDLRYALRTMRRSPAYTAGAALLLALGIGANTAVYSFLEAVVFRPLPVSDPQSLVLVKWQSRGNPKVKQRHTGESHTDPSRGYVSGNFPYRAYEFLAANSGSFVNAFAFYGGGGDGATVLARDSADRANCLFVSGEFFSGLRLPPAAGRMIDPQDERPGSPPAVVIGYSYWQTRFGGSADVVGQTIHVNNVPFVVAGVSPKGFVGLDTGKDAQVYLPLRFCDAILFAGRGLPIFRDDHWYWVQMMARLRPGVSREQAESAMAASWAGWVASTAATEEEKADLPALYLMSGATGLDFLQAYYSRPVFVIAIMAGLILAIACANLANLQLARATARRREILMRYSLGAGRWRVARQLLTESVLLAGVGGVASLAFAWAGMQGLGALAGVWVRDVTFRAEMNWNCLLVAAGLAAVTGLLFGMAPALQASRLQLSQGLRGSRIGGSASWLRRVLPSAGLRSGLVTLQIALSLLLVAGASLFFRTVANLQATPLGFNPDHLLAFAADAYQAGYKGEAMGRFYGEVERRLREIPGARAVTSASYALVSGSASGLNVTLPANPAAGKVGTPVLWVGAGFFQSMQIPIAAGRDINERDTTSSPMVVVVNEAFAAKHLQPGNPLGQLIRFGDPENATAVVVGVARNTLLHSLRKAPEPILFGAYPQHLARITRMTFLIRGSGEALPLAQPARRAVEALDARIPLIDVRTIGGQIRARMGQERLFASLCGAFAILALVIASVGLYATLSYGVSRRTGEIGVRIALGAGRGRVVGMVLRESLAMIVAGLAIGIPVVWSSAKVLESFLFRAAPNDVRALVVPVAVLLGAALVAAGVPAYRAARIDPMQALRHE